MISQSILLTFDINTVFHDGIVLFVLSSKIKLGGVCQKADGGEAEIIRHGR